MRFVRAAWISAFLLAAGSSGGAQQVKVPDAVKKAQAKLAESPDDGDANLTVGKYFALDLGDWEKGLPHLAKGSDKALGSAAQKDIDGANTGPLRVGIGDAWVELLKKLPKNRAQILDRASKWYGEAWQDLDNVWKSKLRDQLRKLNGVPADPEKRPPGASASGWKDLGDVYGTLIDDTFARSGRRSMKVVRPGNKDPAATNHATTVSYPTKGSKVHELTFSYLTDGTDADIPMQILFLDGGGKQLPKEGGVALLSDEPFWHKIRLECESPPDAARVVIAVSGKIKKGAGWLDDLSMKVEGKELLQNGGFEEK
jgi:hypothetical protein